MFNQSAKSLGSLHVAELARKANVTPATVRYYARTGLIHSGRESDNGYRCFSTSDMRRIAFIRRAKALGLTIGDIKAILDTSDQGEVPCDEVKLMVERRLTRVRAHIAELEEKEARIRRAISTWERMDEPAPANGELCPLIERLDGLNGDARTRERLQ
ncbi:MAG: MerR family transcriptional regulator [Wenzhouxiangellaceae bacterium]